MVRTAGHRGRQEIRWATVRTEADHGVRHSSAAIGGGNAARNGRRCMEKFKELCDGLGVEIIGRLLQVVDDRLMVALAVVGAVGEHLLQVVLGLAAYSREKSHPFRK